MKGETRRGERGEQTEPRLRRSSLSQLIPSPEAVGGDVGSTAGRIATFGFPPLVPWDFACIIGWRGQKEGQLGG